MPAYEVTIEKTVRAAIPYDAADDAAAIERARELLERAIDHPEITEGCLLYTSPSPRDQRGSRMPSSA